ncbi:hypothetical protein SKAU_G00059600 [Synaphobranchus kaupii]|uniref:Uncharacterized protein n=1 Tax=Synaphobranchus kaupii TaxID=118154 RepID=A0A9Q1G607_SYNKA|nr:hypothetical protein SKAU_G00059600 [Synaphobranchus kaupii]
MACVIPVSSVPAEWGFSLQNWIKTALRSRLQEKKAVQIFLVSIAFLMVPWLLLVKPLLLYRDHKNGKQTDQGVAEANAIHKTNNNTETVS